MAYSTADDIQLLIKWVVFTSSSRIKLSELDDYIDEADTFIDSKLERLYQTPITDSNDIKILKYVSSRLAANEVAQVLVLQASGEIPPIIKKWYDTAIERLERILDMTIDLPNSTKLTSNKGLYSYTSDTNNECTHIFTMSGDEW